MTKAELLQEVLDGLKMQLVARLENDQRVADDACKEATDETSRGVYAGYKQHAKDMLALVEALQAPDLCVECEDRLTTDNQRRHYRFMCDDCGDFGE